ncbi:hypothetical protein [Nocardioides mangrovi]|uniref:FtsX-like permease family protein n=1 Tax=Nocardioides mangrovi TaxID=2874580 RepID=A0ABS7U976_9ACTN|nr:hypothetical protein [Nocardioides mangrovi]MBZ5737528.1 hypothetical protein [Nocardioides mangrovi]
MIRPAAHALWRAAPGRLLRSPGWGALVLLAVTLVVASVVAPRLFVDTAGATALRSGLAAGDGTRYGEGSGDLRVTWDAVIDRDGADDLLDALAAMPSYGDPVLTAADTSLSISLKAVAVANGATSTAAMWYHDGAIEALGGDPDADGVWLPTEVADELGLEVGDKVKLGTISTFLGEDLTVAPTVLAGTYDPVAGGVLPAQLAKNPDAGRWFYPTNAEAPTVSLPLAILGRSTFDRMMVKIADTPIYTADLRLDPDVTPDGAAAAVARTKRLGKEAFDGSTDLYFALASGQPRPATLTTISGLPRISESADLTATSAERQVHPHALAGQALAVLLLVSAWVLLGRSRRREQLVASGFGLHPVELALLAGLEALLACLVAVPAGLGLAVLSVHTAGPSDGAILTVGAPEVGLAARTAGAALLLLAATTGIAAFATDRLDRVSRLGRGRVVVPWSALLVVATAVVAFGVLSADPSDRNRSPFIAAFAFLVAASVAMVVIRAVGWLRSRRTTRARPGTPRWLAARRTGPVVREITALTAVVAVALALFSYSLTVRRGVDVGVADKTAALAGAPTTIEVAESLRAHGTERAVLPPVDGTTVVWTRGVTLPPDFGQFPLLAIDPDSFADVADWGASDDVSGGRRLVPRLDRRSKVLPVILVGDTDLEVGATSIIVFDGSSSVPIRVVGVVPAFPGSEADPGVLTAVADSRWLFRLVPPTIDPRKEGSLSKTPGAFTSFVWSRDSASGLRADLDQADVATDGVVATAADARIDNGLVASSWAAGYVLALGVVLLVLALAAGLLLALRLAERDTTSDVLLRRMGFRDDELARARAWELAAALATAALAAGAAVGVLLLAPTTIDASPSIPPIAHPRTGVADAAVPVAGLALLVLLAWLAESLPVRRHDPAEVLRGGG